MKSLPWGVIADDLTGATDVAAAFAEAGFSSVVVIDPARARRLDARVLVLSSNSRQCSPALARRKVRAAWRWLQTRGAALLYKKMDSTLHGNILPEVLALRAAGQFDTALVCPANPSQGRIIQAGRLAVRGTDRGSLLERLGIPAKTSARRPGLTDVASVLLPYTSRDLEGTLRASPLVLADATQQQHLTRLVEAAMRSERKVFPAGSAGMAAALARWLARTHGAQRRPRRRKVVRGVAPRLPFLMLSGSNNPVAQQQIEFLRQRAGALVIGLTPAAGVLASDALGQGRPVVVRVPIHAQTDGVILRALRSLRPLLSGGEAGGLVLIGGDTAWLVCRWLQPYALAIDGEILPGLAWGRWIGGVADGLSVCTKPGGFGAEDALAQLAAAQQGGPAKRCCAR